MLPLALGARVVPAAGGADAAALAGGAETRAATNTDVPGAGGAIARLNGSRTLLIRAFAIYHQPLTRPNAIRVPSTHAMISAAASFSRRLTGPRPAPRC